MSRSLYLQTNLLPTAEETATLRRFVTLYASTSSVARRERILDSALRAHAGRIAAEVVIQARLIDAGRRYPPRRPGSRFNGA